MIYYFDCRTGFYDDEYDIAYITDDYGTLVEVPFSLPSWFFQEV